MGSDEKRLRDLQQIGARHAQRAGDLEQEIARLREALQFYAAEVNWCPQSMAWNAASGTTLGQSNVQDDLGQRARKALEGNDG